MYTSLAMIGTINFDSMQVPDSAIHHILSQLTALGAHLSVEGEKLRCHLSGAELPPHLAQQIRDHKPALMAYIQSLYRPALPSFVATEQTQGGLSSVQTRIWLHEQMHPDSLFYQIPFAVRLRGRIHPEVMQSAWQQVCQRHPALRTVDSEVQSEVGPQQTIMADVPTLSIETWPSSTAAETQSLEVELRTVALKLLSSQGSARRKHPVIARLFRREEGDWILLLILHHGCADGWSLGIMLDELMQLHAAAPQGHEKLLPAPPGNYLDFVAWQRAYLNSSAGQHDAAYWKQALLEAPQQVRLSPSVDTSQPNQCVRYKLVPEPSFYPRLTAWARSQGVSVYAGMLSAWSVLLHFLGAQNDLVVGTVVAGRPHAQFEKMVGCFMNTLPMRIQVNEQASFVKLIKQVHQDLLSALEHQHCPIDHIVDAVQADRRYRNPLFNIAVLLQNFPQPDPAQTGIQADLLDIYLDGLGLDLRLVGAEYNGEFRLLLDYHQQLFTPSGVEVLLANYVGLLEAVMNVPACSIHSLGAELRWSEHLTRWRKCVIAASFTADPLSEAFDFLRDNFELPYVLEFAPYAQIVQGLLDPHSMLNTQADHGCLLLRLDDWWDSTDIASADRKFHEQMQTFMDACITYTNRAYKPLTLLICPHRLDAQLPALQAFDQAESSLVAALSANKTIQIITRSHAHLKTGFAQQDDASIDPASPIPYAAKTYTALATLIIRDLSSRTRSPLKAVVLDADNTLWHGICAEDGIEGIKIDAPAAQLQNFFLQLRQQGVALCLCSKNIESDVREVFDKHPDMLMRWSDFSAHRVNWQPKSQNIRELAECLNIGIDSMAFVDDNPAEVSEVETAIPEVLCVNLPTDRAETLSFLHGIWEFDSHDTSGEGARRLATYALSQARTDLRSQLTNLDDYVAALQVKVVLRPAQISEMARTAELTQRTNQFNFSGKRKSIQDVEAWLQRAHHGVLIAEVSDRFGDYGITGALLYRCEGKTCLVDNFLLSCRVLGKKVEDTILEQLSTLMHAQGMHQLQFELIQTARNEPASRFASDALGSAIITAQGVHQYTYAIRQYSSQSR
jgi:FkbH-like protein